MAPKKEKAEKASGDAAADLILNYLKQQNRPYSANDVSANLHNKVTKAATAKILKELHEARLIEGRAAGKQWVYHALQDPSTSSSASALASLDARLSALRASTASAVAAAKPLRATLAALLSSSLPTPALRLAVERLETEKAELARRLALLTAGAGADAAPAPTVPKEEMQRLEAEERSWEARKRRRRTIVREMWAAIAEGCPDGVDLAELREQLGLDD